MLGLVARRVFADNEPIVETSSGRIRGISEGKVQSFKGVPYAASTAGTNRFIAPRPPEPRTGIRDTIAFAGYARQWPSTTPRRPELKTWLGQPDTTLTGEDCPTVNVWAPGSSGGAKRPVMVSLHGGRIAYGSANRPVHDDRGELARRGDVVVVGVNHRLNGLGFVHLADIGGQAYGHSGNTGMLDLVAAPRWVHENIERFGGDRGNVTIFGQSGGGGKVIAGANAERVIEPRARPLAAAVSATWAAFAGDGNPDNPAMPHWPGYTFPDRATMVLDTTCRIDNDPGRDARLLWGGIVAA